MALASDTRLGHYRIVTLIGTGGMGEVYEAEDTRLGRHVAIKFLPDTRSITTEAADRFEREARIASSLNHPNICTIYDVGVHGDRRFIVMELLDGDSLRSRISGRPLPVDQLLVIACQIADALVAAHARGIVHRDITPANIFLTRRGQAKLLDFGIAKIGSERQATADAETRRSPDALTAAGTAMGSINYMSPEQARGEDLDARTDLFSFGVVLYEMATGHQAFAGQTSAIVFDSILNREPPASHSRNPAIPEALEHTIARAIEKDRSVRFQTAADLLADLMRLRRDSDRAEVVAAPLPTPMPARRRSKWLIAGLPIVLLALGAAAYALFAGRTRKPALTDSDTLLVADFVNTTQDPVFDDALKQAVTVQLQQTPFITLLSDQSVQRTLRLMQREASPVTGAVARELCQRAGAKAAVEGSIAPLGTTYVIAIGVHNCQTGDALAEQQVQAKSKEEVLTTLGGAVKTLRQHLGESLATVQKYDVPVTEATTTSLEALRAYGLANRARATQGYAASIPLYEQAIRIDPNFALAYAKLAVSANVVGRSADASQYARHAYELRDRVSEYEKLYIEWNYSTKVSRDPQVTYTTLMLMTSTYPRDYTGWNNLGVYYTGRGEFDSALAQYLKAIAASPDEPGALRNATNSLVILGRLDEALPMAARALAAGPDTDLPITLWLAAAMANDPRATALEEAARKAASDRQFVTARAGMALWRGQFHEYQRLQDVLAAQARVARDDAWLKQIEFNTLSARAICFEGASRDRVRELLAPGHAPWLAANAAVVLASTGGVEEVRPILHWLDRAVQGDDTVRLPFAIAGAYVRAADGQNDGAIGDLGAAAIQFTRAMDINFHLGRIREMKGDFKGAADGYRNAIGVAPYLRLPPLTLLSRLYLGNALLRAGDTVGAAQQYDRLIAQWKDADADFPPLKKVKDARAGISR